MKTMKVELNVSGKNINIEIVNEGGVYSSYYQDFKLLTGLQTVEEAVVYTHKFLRENKAGARFRFE